MVSFDSGQFYLQAKTIAADAATAGPVEHHHFPFARRARVRWTRIADGWTFRAEDEHMWEVFCAECGDTDGPANLQSPGVQQLRGPYKHEHHARHVATKHFEEN